METHTASCHCGAVEISARFPNGLASASRCDCSFCLRRGAAAVVVGQEIWLIGGISARTSSAAVDIYDVSTSTWREGPALPEPRAGHAAAVLDGRIHVFGGRSADMQRTVRDHFQLDPATLEWTEGPELPVARTEAAAAALGNEVWLIGGGAGAGFFAPFTAVDTVDVIRPTGEG